MSTPATIRGTSTRAGRVLVCDDERNIVRLVQVHMERYGHTVTPVYDGRDALELVQTREFDLLILDVMMPGMDGIEVLKSIRRNPKTADLPVIMLTAKSEDEDVFKAYQSGAHMYLTKPVDLAELASFVKTLIG